MILFITAFIDGRHSKINIIIVIDEFATEAIRAGVDVETVSKTLGHFSVGFTLDVYGHVTQEMKVEAAKRMQQAIDNRRNR